MSDHLQLIGPVSRSLAAQLRSESLACSQAAARFRYEDEAGSGNLFLMQTPHPEVRGIDLDRNTRCAHYRTDRDIVAIKMKCCGLYYACKDCHEALADHPIEVWSEAEWNQLAVLCGACQKQMTIRQYMESGSMCPECGAAFNPGCRKHYQFYFASAD